MFVSVFDTFFPWHKWAYIKYVRTEGGGVQKLADYADKQSYRSADKGGRGPKNSKILQTNLMEAP